MLHPQLAQKRADYEFERRFNLVGLAVFMAVMPLLVFVTVAYLQTGFFSPVAFNAALLVYGAVVFVSSTLARRAIVSSLRREGLATQDYQPPSM